jgi:hypothetical protein
VHGLSATVFLVEVSPMNEKPEIAGPSKQPWSPPTLTFYGPVAEAAPKRAANGPPLS